MKMEPIGIKSGTFGVPDTIDPHHVIVRIQHPRVPVHIWEDFGAAASPSGPRRACRADVQPDVWRRISEDVNRYLNGRLKGNGLKTCRFRTGDNLVDRILGRELIVLAWGIQDATGGEAARALDRLSNYRPEEIWWIFQQVVRDGGQWDSPRVGWRAAIRCALIT